MNRVMKVFVAMLVLAISIAWVGAASAAFITWTAGPTTITSVNDISLTGTLVSAGQVASGTTNVVVGTATIPFVDIPWDDTGSHAKLSGAAPVLSEYGPWADAFSPPEGFDANFTSVLQTVAYANSSNAGGGYLALTLKGLTTGYSYQVQVFASNDSTNGSETMHYSDANTAGTGHETSVFTMSTSPYVIGTFTADGATQTVYGLQDAQNSGNAYSAVLQGYVLRQTATPEPGTIVLLVTGLVGLLAYAWRKRR